MYCGGDDDDDEDEGAPDDDDALDEDEGALEDEDALGEIGNSWYHTWCNSQTSQKVVLILSAHILSIIQIQIHFLDTNAKYKYILKVRCNCKRQPKFIQKCLDRTLLDY